MVAMTRWSQAADANGFRGQFFNHCCGVSRFHISTIHNLHMAPTGNVPSQDARTAQAHQQHRRTDKIVLAVVQQ